VARQVAELSEELGAIFESVSTNPPDDEHDAEGSTVGFERARVSALLDHARSRLSELDAALEQPDAGGLRACEECGLAIPPERLAALPETRRCAACSAQSGQRGPLRPPRR
jgi:RNA polymerase-binding transcription factor DksA